MKGTIAVIFASVGLLAGQAVAARGNRACPLRLHQDTAIIVTSRPGLNLARGRRPNLARAWRSRYSRGSRPARRRTRRKPRWDLRIDYYDSARRRARRQFTVPFGASRIAGPRQYRALPER